MSSKAKMFLTILAVMLAVSAFMGFQFYREWQKLQSLNAEKAKLAAELDAKHGENAELQQSIDDSTSAAFIERYAREVLGWVKPGEIKIVDKDK